MQIVIDIDEQDYVYIAKKHCLPSCDDKTLRKNVYEMIAKGIPLPKGHGRLIDADSVIKYWKPDHNRQFVADYFIHTLEVADVVIEADKEG